jgi:glycosyltransferase involved in cell wall biosynthesis
MNDPLVSICLSTYNKSAWLRPSLDSIFQQAPPFGVEVIVVDDGSDRDTEKVCRCFPVHYHRIDRDPGYRNPSLARNEAYKLAKGKIIIAQSDDVMHKGNAIEALVAGLKPGTFTIATVTNTDFEGNPVSTPLYNLTGPNSRRPYFFLGALYRDDCYAIGGNDEGFTSPGFDDDDFAFRLMYGLGLQPVYLGSALACHVDHSRPANFAEVLQPSESRWRWKMRMMATGGLPILDPFRAWSLASKIPRRMSFFWAGRRMSWMRWMTLKSFRHYNPDWDVTLYFTERAGDGKWQTGELMDAPGGKDRMQNVADLGIKIVTANWFPIDIAPAHQSDFLEWRVLEEGGWYSDMDILYTAPMDALHNASAWADAVFVPEAGYLAIGLLAGAPGCRLWHDVYHTAAAIQSESVYQSTGVDAIYRLSRMENYHHFSAPAVEALTRLRIIYAPLKIADARQDAIYPYDWRNCGKIFTENADLPPGNVGVHWFGGSATAQRFNAMLSDDNWRDTKPNTFTMCAKMVLDDVGYFTASDDADRARVRCCEEPRPGNSPRSRLEAE